MTKTAPLSLSQEWVKLARFTADAETLREIRHFVVRGFDADAVSAAIAAVGAHQLALGLRVRRESGQLCQVFVDEPTCVVRATERQAVGPDAADACVLDAVALGDWDVATEPTFRAVVADAADQDAVALGLAMDHYVADDQGADLVAAQIEAVLRHGPSALPPLRRDIADESIRSHEWWQRSGADRARELAELVAGGRAVRVARSAAGEGSGWSRVTRHIDHAGASAFERAARAGGFSIASAVLTAVAVALGRSARQDCLVLATAVANRTRGSRVGLVGSFALPAFVQFADIDRSFAELAADADAQLRRISLGEAIPPHRLLDVVPDIASALPPAAGPNVLVQYRPSRSRADHEGTRCLQRAFHLEARPDERRPLADIDIDVFHDERGLTFQIRAFDRVLAPAAADALLDVATRILGAGLGDLVTAGEMR